MEEVEIQRDMGILAPPGSWSEVGSDKARESGLAGARSWGLGTEWGPWPLLLNTVS